MPITQLPEPELFTARTGEPALRWGLIGPGWIAGEFVSAAHRHTAQRFTAVSSRSADRSAAFAATHGIPSALDDHRALVDHPEVDVVYIATPQSEHVELGLLAIAAGKHVLIEKPIALTAAEGQQLADAGHAAGVLVMEAMWSRYLPQMSVVRQLLADGLLGDVEAVHADHGQAIPADPQHRLYRPELGGGALLDLGIYPVQFDSMVLGAPTEVVATGGMTQTGVDAYSTLALRHGGIVQSTITTTMLTRTPTRASISGSAARLDFDSFFYTPSAFRVLANDPNAPTDGPDLGYTDGTGLRLFDGLSWEATALATFVGEGRTESPLHTLDETISILATIDSAKEQLRADAAGAEDRNGLEPDGITEDGVAA
ncbi:Gfo/Idh/MocA family protein [Curtobacterium sp. PhB115]|uniref:Gfo/Idh/MocA family protein n=1 Tax=Curtobacterium sp. PhB115 TaxID=2485173 RepID=UPI000F4CC6B3|nr:Gfo/Idh/MocA family oxidoreductase [Curtobacterium sp. PhB115]ROP72615.1 putative dehydrogenase [Curtobacterium sp. PhB115]